MLAFHPTTLNNNNNQFLAPFPTALQLLLQVTVFFAVEAAFHACVLRFIQFPRSNPLDEISKVDRITSVPIQTKGDARGNDTDHDDLAEALVMEFIQPRGALLIGVALLGMQTSWLTARTGVLHPMAMVLWVVTRQIPGIGTPSGTARRVDKMQQ